MTGAQAACGTSRLEDSVAAAREAAGRAGRGLDRRPVDLALVFFSSHHAAQAEQLADAVRTELLPGTLAGATTEAAIGGGRELEDVPAVSVLAAALPGADISAVPISAGMGPEGAVLNVPSTFAPPGPEAGAALVVADPYSFPVTAFLDLMGSHWDGAIAVGGLASGGAEPGEHALVCDGQVLRRGAVVVTVGGAAELRALVSQGCAPIGPEMVVTGAAGNVVTELAGQPAYERLTEVVEALSPEMRGLAAGGLLAGLVIDENRAEYGPGDYLMRGLMGADPQSGALVLAAQPRIGQTLRFHVRDAEIADRELRDALRAEAAIAPGRMVGGVLFACNGRGRRMFDAPDHDAAAVEQELGLPTAGMFCSGEIGPVGGSNFLHGFTATMALIVERPAS
jgi:small ligand-binding sensory domain FIST